MYKYRVPHLGSIQFFRYAKYVFRVFGVLFFGQKFRPAVMVGEGVVWNACGNPIIRERVFLGLYVFLWESIVSHVA